MKRRYPRWLVPLCLLSSGMTFGAAPEPTEAPPPQAESGKATRQWLERQRQGQHASGKPSPLSGAVQEQIYERYQKSFSHPIPEHLANERASSASASR
ncbi:DUF3613 domain-containing protein [Dechloromonas sp. A34]|uniref:DUF3613 domain-containing protein n=1 Tax=Dechloromonas sp. A34 TaxID=447588 RepID=UPI002248E0D9|nr:DUF3613 domain-containing protein [Dechloromonas sp. A34]